MSEPADSEYDETMAPTPAAPTAPPAATLRFNAAAGQIELPKYRIGQELGRGGMGSVLAAEDQELERTVAVKVMLAGAAASDPARIRFEREAKVLARLEHPNIVPVHESGCSADDRPFYTMKLVKGRTLQSIINGIREGDAATLEEYKLDELLTVFRKVCDAIAFAHHSGIVHRDLKPENVMVGEFGEVLVMDWGLAKILAEGESESPTDRAALAGAAPTGCEAGSMTLDGQILGTPQYMAPEQASGAVSSIDARTDVYSLGGILHAILSLEAPVSGRSLGEIIGRIERGERNELSPGKSARAGHCPLNVVPQPLTAVVSRAMSVRPADRYQTIDELSREVAAFQGGFSTAAERASRWRRLGLFVNRHRTVSLASLLGLAGVMYTFMFSLMYLRGEQRRLMQEASQYRQSERDFRSLRWQAIRELRRPPTSPPGEGWQDLWKAMIAGRDDPGIAPWVLGNRGLASPPGRAAVLPLPEVNAPHGWTLRLTIRKIFNAGALAILIPGERHHQTILLDARRDDRRITGLEPAIDLDAVAGQMLDTVVIKPDGDWHRLELDYRPADAGSFTLKTKLDGKQIINWSGGPDRLNQNDFWKPYDPTRLHLAANGGNWMIEAITIRPHSKGGGDQKE